MPKPDPIDRVHRTVHLSGGRRAECSIDGRVLLDPVYDGLGAIALQATSYYGVFDQLIKLGLSVVGVDFVMHEGDVTFPSPGSWRSRTVIANIEWPTNHFGQSWGFVGDHAAKLKNGYIWDLAKRISHQHRLTNWRFRELSEAYHAQALLGLENVEKMPKGRFANEFTEVAYSTMQSFLIDACILRDNLAEFYWWYLKHTGIVHSAKSVTTMGGLIDRYLKTAKVATKIDQLLLECTAKSGWLSALTDYRNLVVHVAPLTLAENVLFASWLRTDISGRDLVGVKLPLPQDPSALSRKRNDGSLFDDPEGTRATFANVMKDDQSALDCLQYASTVLANMALLSWHVIYLSPIEPKMMMFQIVDGELKEMD